MNLEIQKLNYWEHFKAAKDMALVYPLNDPRRVAVENEMNILIKQINKHENNIALQRAPLDR